MRRIVLVMVALAIQTSIAMAREVHVCEAESEVKEGARVTTTGRIMEIYKCSSNPGKCLGLESFEQGFDYCIVSVYPKGKIPSNCKVGSTATVTGVAREFLDTNDLHDAKIRCK